MAQYQKQTQLQWKGPERRVSQGFFTGEERRQNIDPGELEEAAGGPGVLPRTGVNAEEPMDEQEERELAQERGPNPRIPK